MATVRGRCLLHCTYHNVATTQTWLKFQEVPGSLSAVLYYNAYMLDLKLKALAFIQGWHLYLQL